MQEEGKGSVRRQRVIRDNDTGRKQTRMEEGVMEAIKGDGRRRRMGGGRGEGGDCFGGMGELGGVRKRLEDEEGGERDAKRM